LRALIAWRVKWVTLLKKSLSVVGSINLKNLHWGVLEQDSEENTHISEGGTNRRLEKTAHCGCSYLVLLAKCYWNDQIKENEMGEPLSMHGREQIHTEFW
jgi:hypothetical protein